MIRPEPTPQTKPFWSAAAEGRFLLQFCTGCNSWLHPQAGFCPCPQPRLQWRPAAGTGTLLSYTAVHHTPVPALAAPFTLTLVRLAEGPRYISSLPGLHPSLQVGLPMRVIFDPIDTGIALPRFVPAAP